jgi:predicted DNA-binding ribbon-helix-helix protein
MASRDMSEIQRRELANAHRGEVVPGSGRPVEGRRLGQMISLRLEPDTIATLRGIANRRGVTVSDLLREGAGMVLAADQQLGTVTVTYRVTVSAPQARTSEITTYSINPTTVSQVRPATA